MADQQRPNHLSGQSSPYLIQHLYNPVDWYPWGPEAFQLAAAQSKPIFLSIGYATCHWCHVMERESFENPQVADLMNSTFVNIKVDREEFPQVDSLYMDFAQAMLGGGGGWPLNLVLTPDLKPIFAATYLPPHGRLGQLGMVELCQRIGEIWQMGPPEEVFDQADRLVEAVEGQQKPLIEDLPDVELLESVADLFYQMADPVYGGLQGAPKFPIGYQINLLLRHAVWRSESRALFYAQNTLEMMYRGGIYDHLGGGFARYTVDSEWLIPHFEKMLCDNALLAWSYTEGWLVTREPLFRTVAEEVFSYLLRDMRGEEGGFHSAQDADSEGREGGFYTWTPQEVASVLGPADATLLCAYYDISAEGNFEGRSVLHAAEGVEEFARARGLDPITVGDRLATGREKMWSAREERPHPAKDDKVIVGWNGLAIRAFADAALAFSNPHYLEVATEVAQFIHQHFWVGERLLRRWRNGEAGLAAVLEDYSFLISGLLSLFRSGGGARWLGWAIQLSNVLIDAFKAESGGYYRTDRSDPHLLIDQQELYDGAEPSGNALQCENLIRLYQITGVENYLAEAQGILKLSKPFIERHPLGATYHCIAVQRWLDSEKRTLVFALGEGEEELDEIRRALSQRLLPHTEFVWVRPAEQEIFQLIPHIQHQKPLEGKTALYPCKEGVCENPAVGADEIVRCIASLRKL